MSFALLGVIAMQLYFLMQSYDLQSKQFDRVVNEALNNVVEKLGKHDADKFLAKKAIRKAPVTYSANSNPNDDFESEKYESPIKLIPGDTLQSSVESIARKKRMALLTDSLQRLIFSKQMNEAFSGPVDMEFYIDNFGNMRGRLTSAISSKPVTQHGKISKYDTIYTSYIDPLYGLQKVALLQPNPLWQKEQLRKENERRIRKVKKQITEDSLKTVAEIAGSASYMQNILTEYERSGEPLKKRLDRTWIDSLLRFELQSRNIDLPFDYDVTNANGDSLIFTSAADSGKKPVFTADNTYQTAIFTKDVVNDPGKIILSFPQKNSLILGRMKASMATTAGLLFVLIFCFGYTLMTIIKQKKISEMKTDFINNMTHEFKTPVSTIMIASESLRDPEINSDKSRIARLANIIYEENARLGNHIERVLNIARIDKDDFKLENKPVNINDLIAIVLDSMELKLQKCDAEIILELSAENPVIIADELHFSNVLYNLIDNAIKYSEGKPKITINSFNKNGQVVIKVADEGIGMSRDQQTKIFEQFYRIPTGNVHNVKGFGLGLSYVNTIVKRLNGSISVRSEKDKGSEFELKFATA